MLGAAAGPASGQKLHFLTVQQLISIGWGRWLILLLIWHLSRLPNSFTNYEVRGPKTPEVSTESGTDYYSCGANLCTSISSLRNSILAATSPAAQTARFLYDSAKVSAQVASISHHRLSRFPCHHRNTIRSYRLPSFCMHKVLVTPVLQAHE